MRVRRKRGCPVGQDGATGRAGAHLTSSGILPDETLPVKSFSALLNAYLGEVRGRLTGRISPFSESQDALADAMARHRSQWIENQVPTFLRPALLDELQEGD